VDEHDIVAGTAFAVSPSLLISAMHVFEHNVDFFACEEIKRTTSEVIYEKGKYKVKIVARGDANVDELDFVVLELSVPSEKQLSYLPIATQVVKGEHVRLYCAFNAPGFNEFTQDFCNIGIDAVLLITTISGCHIYCGKGAEAGNSGGPYINRRGEVVAIHTNANNNIPDIEKYVVKGATAEVVTKARKKRLLVADVDAKVSAVDTKVTDVTDKVVELCDVVSRVSNTHTSHSIGLMIKSCPILCAFLRSKGVNV